MWWTLENKKSKIIPRAWSSWNNFEFFKSSSDQNNFEFFTSKSDFSTESKTHIWGHSFLWNALNVIEYKLLSISSFLDQTDQIKLSTTIR